MYGRKTVIKTLSGVVLATTIILNATACSSDEPKHIVSHADYKEYSDTKDAVRDADIIVIGKVKKKHPPQEWNINLDKSEPPVNQVYTLSEIEVLESVKGPAPGTTITIKQAGGKYKGAIYEEDGTQFVQLGKEYLLFLDSFEDWSPNEPYTLINPSQGMIEVNNGAIQPQDKANYLKTGVSTKQILEDLKAINATLPPKNKNVDQDLLNKIRNK